MISNRFEIRSLDDVSELAAFLATEMGISNADRNKERGFFFKPDLESMDPIEFSAVLSVLALRTKAINITIRSKVREAYVSIVLESPAGGPGYAV